MGKHRSEAPATVGYKITFRQPRHRSDAPIVEPAEKLSETSPYVQMVGRAQRPSPGNVLNGPRVRQMMGMARRVAE